MYNKNNMLEKLIKSWATKEGYFATTDDILNWIRTKNALTQVNISRITLQESLPWYYEDVEGAIKNSKGNFFAIKGFKVQDSNGLIFEQPILLQPEIGYLGIIIKEINGVLHFLMQAKIEPGNINKVQLSPTIQATKSNFTQVHGGRKPAYLDYFVNATKYEIVVDQIQSEQSSRFYKKRNRNIILKIDEEIEILDSHKWMTLGQIKELMKVDNLVNMDTRTVLACIPFSLLDSQKAIKLDKYFSDETLYRSIFNKSELEISKIYNYINDYKMFKACNKSLVPLKQLEQWEFNDQEIKAKEEHSFKVIFCNIEIEGREVSRWTQPLFEATGEAVFGLICCNFNGVKKFLVQCNSEIGCFDEIEVGPTVQLEANYVEEELNLVDKIFFGLSKRKEKIRNDVMLSEEGGRFYCEQNRNIIIEIDAHDIETMGVLPKSYFWCDYATLNYLVQINNCLNIQLRNLLSLLEV